MANRLLLGIVSAASLPIVNQAFGVAHQIEFGIRLGATPNGAVTHYGMSLAGCPEDMAIMLQRYNDGVLPEEGWNGPLTWGDNGLPSEQDVIDACDPTELHFHNVSGDVTPTTAFDAMLAPLGLVKIVDE